MVDLAQQQMGGNPEDTFNLEGIKESGGPMLSEQMQADRRQGSSLPDRALRTVRGTGPHTMTSGAVKQATATSGRMDRVMRGQDRRADTGGRQARQQLGGARELRQDGRDRVHYNQEFGTVMSNEVAAQARQQEKDFKQYVADTNTQLQDYRNQIANDRVNVKNQYNAGVNKINSEYQKAMSQIPPTTTLSNEYNKWYNSSANHRVEIWSGSNPNAPGGREAAYKATPDQLRHMFGELAKNGITVLNNRVYVKGRGQEIHDAFRTVQNSNKAKFYEKNANSVRERNASIARAKTQLNQQKAQGMTNLQNDYSNATTQLSKAEGAVQGRQQGLDKEITAHAEDLKQVRQSYKDRLAKIDQALGQSVARSVGSRSEAVAPKQLSPIRPGAQA